MLPYRLKKTYGVIMIRKTQRNTKLSDSFYCCAAGTVYASCRGRCITATRSTAAIRRERKKKKKSQTSEKHAEPSGAPVDAAVNPASASSDTAQISAHNVSTRSSQSIQLDENRYQYVKQDLRRSIIIAVPLIVILIILAFVL